MSSRTTPHGCSCTEPVRGWLLPTTFECSHREHSVELCEIWPPHRAVASPAVPAASIFHHCGSLLCSRVYSIEYVSAFARYLFAGGSPDRITSEEYSAEWDREAARAKWRRYHPGLGSTPEPRDITLDWGRLLPPMWRR